MKATLLHGDVLERLAELPANSVHCIVTSPPYYGLRSYLADDHADKALEIGLEDTPEAYIARMVCVFREVRRVLRPDGCLWLNIGDSWANNTQWRGQTSGKHAHALQGQTGIGRRRTNTGLKNGDMIGIPWRTAFALQADGWFLRSDVVWHKLNPLPESLTGWRWERHLVKGANAEECPGCPKCEANDGLVLRRGSWRPTRAHEQLFLLTKSEHYFCDKEAVREPQTGNARPRGTALTPKATPKGGEVRANLSFYAATSVSTEVAGGRNRRSVWSLTSEPQKEKHYAAFPRALVRPCILASTSEHGCCRRCGTPWARVLKKDNPPNDGQTASSYAEGMAANRLALKRQAARERGEEFSDKTQTLGWRACCDCHAGDPVPCTVLDPFCGSGTVGVVALESCHDFIGIDLSADYIAIARRRLTPHLQRVLF